jgi:trafficking protein particle complex subunit 8
VAVKSARPVSLTVTHVKFDFLSLLSSSEPLASRGRRLQETKLQRQSVMYAPDVLIKVEVEEASQKLVVNFVDDGPLVLAQGECKEMALWFSNTGTRGIDEVWMIAAPEEEIWLGLNDSQALRWCFILGGWFRLNPFNRFSNYGGIGF